MARPVNIGPRGRRYVLQTLASAAAGLGGLCRLANGDETTTLPPGSDPLYVERSERDLAKPQSEQRADPRTSLIGTPWQHSKLVAIGHSHLVAILAAFRQRNSNPALPDRATFIELLDQKYRPGMVREGNAWRFTPAAAAAIDAAVKPGLEPVPFVVASIGGNEYQFIGMVNHPRPFDFILPSAPELPLTGAEIVPVPAVRTTLRRQLAATFRCLELLRQQIELPMYQIESPPPIPDNQFLTEQQSPFSGKIKEFGVAPAAFRMKLWLLQAELINEKCAELRIGYLRRPQKAVDAQGFMLRPGWRADGVHTNAWYGELVLEQLDQLAADSLEKGARR
jgi:hypothetical protein